MAKMIIYTDGSFGEKGASCGIVFLLGSHLFAEAYVTCKADDNTCAEIMALLKAVANLTYVKNEFEEIEFRTDCSSLAEFLTGRWSNRLDSKATEYLANHFISKYRILLIELLYRLKSLPYIVTIKKVKRKDHWLQMVDKNARRAINEVALNDDQFYLKFAKDLQFSAVPDKYNPLPIKVANQKGVGWYKNCASKIVQVPVMSIRLTEEVHLDA